MLTTSEGDGALHRNEGGPVTPEWELRSNLRFPGGNLSGVSDRIGFTTVVVAAILVIVGMVWLKFAKRAKRLRI